MSTCPNCNLQGVNPDKRCPACGFELNKSSASHYPSIFNLIIQIPPPNADGTCNPNCRLYYIDENTFFPCCGGKFGIKDWTNDRPCDQIIFPGPGCPREEKNPMKTKASKSPKVKESKDCSEDRKSCSEVCKIDCYDEQGNIQICAKKNGWKQPGPNCLHGK